MSNLNRNVEKKERKQARKARRCDSNLKSETINDWPTHWMTGVGAKRCYVSHLKSFWFLVNSTGLVVQKHVSRWLMWELPGDSWCRAIAANLPAQYCINANTAAAVHCAFWCTVYTVGSFKVHFALYCFPTQNKVFECVCSTVSLCTDCTVLQILASWMNGI